MRKLLAHVVNGLDGKRTLPPWFHRVHKLGHLVYYGGMALGAGWLHEKIVWLLFGAEVVSVMIGSDEVRAAVEEFE